MTAEVKNMTIHFEELDYQQTDLGELTLRRRRVPALGDLDIFEVKLGDEFLMSSLFSDGEIALADLGLADLHEEQLDVVVGGLGLGYTAWATLDRPSVRSMLVIEALDEVIHWHKTGLVPLGAKLTADPRCRYINGDFFALVSPTGQGFDPQMPDRRFHAVLLDIDHSPRHLLHQRNATFYTLAGLRHLASTLHPEGVFALWSNDPPDNEFSATLDSIFAESQSHIVTFQNPLTERQVANTIYVARAAG